MYLVRTMRNEEAQERKIGGFVGWVSEMSRWWQKRVMRERRREAKRQMFLVESIQLGPRQRVVLLRCGGDRFLVGTGADGIQSIVRVGAAPETGELPVVAGIDVRWG